MALGKLLSIAANLFGWSPVGKEILIRVDDAGKETLNKSQMRGKIIALTENGNALMEIDNPIGVEGRRVRRFVAVPRHQGYKFDYLWWGGIAVNLFDASETNNSIVNRQETWFAIATLKLIRQLNQ